MNLGIKGSKCSNHYRFMTSLKIIILNSLVLRITRCRARLWVDRILNLVGFDGHLVWFFNVGFDAHN